MKFVENNRYMIETPSGYQNFDGISQQNKKQLLFVLDNQKTIVVSENHPFLIAGKIYNSNDLKIGQDLEIKNKFAKIIDIQQLNCENYVYDILNVQNGNQYYGNDVLNHNCFLGSSYTLINGETIEKFEQLFKSPNKLLEEHKLTLKKEFEQTTINIYKAPQQNRAYVIGGDPSEGGSSDYHAMTVWDITNPFQIELVASYRENNVNPNVFAYVLAKTGTLFNNAYIAIEKNGVSLATLNPLTTSYEYDNIVCEGGDRYSLGIWSDGERRFESILNLKNLLENPQRETLIYDGRIIEEMKLFERRNRPGRAPTYMASSGHDDMILSMCWALYILHPDIIESYYDVKKYGVDKLGNQIPLFVCPFNVETPEEIKARIEMLDKKLNQIGNSYEVTMNKLEQQIREQQSNLLEHFIAEQNNFQDEYTKKSPHIYDTNCDIDNQLDDERFKNGVNDNIIENDMDNNDDFVIGGF